MRLLQTTSLPGAFRRFGQAAAERPRRLERFALDPTARSGVTEIVEGPGQAEGVGPPWYMASIKRGCVPERDSGRTAACEGGMVKAPHWPDDGVKLAWRQATQAGHARARRGARVSGGRRISVINRPSCS